MSGKPSLVECIEALREAAWVGKHGTPEERSGRFDAVTDTHIAAIAVDHSDRVQPNVPERLAGVQRMSMSQLVRMKLAMSRQAFAAAYGIPLDKLIAWERHDAEPDAVALAYLRAIERNPEVNKLVPASSES